MKQTYPSENSQIGYTFSHKQFSIVDGFPNLIAFLRDKPSETHFDPEKITCFSTNNHHPDKITLHNPALQSGKLPLVAGRIILEDRKGHRAEFFTYGGTLTVEEKSGTVQCTFTSTAPIFVLEASEGPRALFAEEAEIVLAERLAKNPQCGEKLVAANPFELFVSLLKDIEAKVEKLPYGRISRLSKLHSFIGEEIKLLNEYDLFPDEITPIAELL